MKNPRGWATGRSSQATRVSPLWRQSSRSPWLKTRGDLLLCAFPATGVLLSDPRWLVAARSEVTMKRFTVVGLALGLICTAATTTAGTEPPKPAPSNRQVLKQRPPVALLFKDIAMDEIRVDAQTCRLWVTWKNVGTAKIDAQLKERVEVYSQPNQMVEHMNHVVLDPGKTFSHAVGGSAGIVIQGPTEVRAQIDVGNVLNESQVRRGNNSIYRTVNCGQVQPDLYPSTLEYVLQSTSTDTQGHTCKIVRVKPVVLNIGTAAVAVPFKVKMEADKGVNRSWEKFYETPVPGIGVGETLTLNGTDIDTCFWFIANPQMPPNDVRRFRLTVDSANDVPESQEGNNQGVKIY